MLLMDVQALIANTNVSADTTSRSVLIFRSLKLLQGTLTGV